jgi:hypothetical protein
MNCDQIQELLGRFHDGEMEYAQRAAVEAHLRSCSDCSTELAAIAELGEMARTACDPPAHLWDHLAQRLAIEELTPFPKTRKALRTWKAGLVAAVVLIASGIAWIANRTGEPGSQGETVAPLSAEREDLLLDDLLSARAGKQVSLQEAARRVDFSVLAASNLPEGYRLCDCCLCQAGCCGWVQCRFLRGTDQIILVQCSPDHTVRYGNRPVLETQVNGKAARVVQCDGCLACSWQNKGTVLTLVGPRDLSQLVGLVAYVDQRLEGKR